MSSPHDPLIPTIFGAVRGPSPKCLVPLPPLVQLWAGVPRLVLDQPPLVARVESIEVRKCARVGRDDVVWWRRCSLAIDSFGGSRRCRHGPWRCWCMTAVQGRRGPGHVGKNWRRRIYIMLGRVRRTGILWGSLSYHWIDLLVGHHLYMKGRDILVQEKKLTEGTNGLNRQCHFRKNLKFRCQSRKNYFLRIKLGSQF
jgi:hypothetical protein